MEDFAQVKLRYGYGREEYVNAMLFCGDFMVTNLLLMLFILYGGDLVPVYFHSATKVSVLVVNVSLAVSEYFFHAIVYRRVMRWGDLTWNVAKLVATQVAMAFVLLRILSAAGMFFAFMLVFGITEYIVLLLTRVAERFALLWLRGRGGNSQNAFFVGNDLSLARMYHSVMQNQATGYHIMGYFADAPMKDCPQGLEWLGDIATLNSRMDGMGEPLPEVHEVYCSLSHNDADEVRRIERYCDRKITRFYYVPRSFEGAERALKPVRIGDYILYTNHQQPLLKLSNRIIKRAFDIVVSLFVCVFLIPITLVVGLAIKLQSPGPIFFGQDRTGINGKTFRCFKFRSMHVNKDADKVQATEHDPRKFPFGDFMRRTNIDELPQFFNVLCGDMSIVGPRPHMLRHTDIYGDLIGNYMVRLFCKPGITGWAQVMGFRGETKETWQMESRVNCDIWYLEHWNFWLDLRIILMTAKTIFVHDKNAY